MLNTLLLLEAAREETPRAVNPHTDQAEVVELVVIEPQFSLVLYFLALTTPSPSALEALVGLTGKQWLAAITQCSPQSPPQEEGVVVLYSRDH
jgi:hypothetical protein